MTRIGLIGLGHVARHHIAAINLAPELSLTATADLKSRPKDLAMHDCPHFASLDQLLRANPPDVVVIATPPATHLALASEAVCFGVDVLLEKPATPSRAEFEDLKSLADATTQRVEVALHAAFGREMLWVEDNLAELAARFGPPRDILCQFRDPYVTGDQVRPEALGLMGSWRDSGINALSVLEKIIPVADARVDDAKLCFFDGSPELDIAAEVEIGWPDGRARIETDWRQHQNLKRTEILFADGKTRLLLHHSGEYAEIQSGSGSERQDLGNGRERLTNHYIALFESYAKRDSSGSEFSLAEPLHELLFDGLDYAATRGIG